jgi:hypothetical protein
MKFWARNMAIAWLAWTCDAVSVGSRLAISVCTVDQTFGVIIIIDCACDAVSFHAAVYGGPVSLGSGYEIGNSVVDLYTAGHSSRTMFSAISLVLFPSIEYQKLASVATICSCGS